ncbi:MAG TPA: ABC transporter permease [Candidatus Saccharimonadales bacterium]|jgi:ABC-2 type transport system permease protein|nr:ABC transporter permease [Candidatus Saccharimonadales bacterium]
MTLRQQLRTVIVFTKLSTRRFFRDRLAQFFAILFPLIFLFVFGSLNKGGNISFNVALINQSHSAFSNSYAGQLEAGKTFKINKSITTFAQAKDKMSKSQIDGIIILPNGFGDVKPGQTYPSGQAQLLYNQSSSGTGQTLTTVLQGTFDKLNNQYVHVQPPFSVSGQIVNQKSLSSFDYTFSGLLGFSIIGLGIFGPVNVFPELKKQGILRRLHTTPLRVWQYFLATMFGQAITGIISIAIQFLIAIKLFHLKVDGNYLEIAIFTILSIFMILGLGLAIGGWAKNERQAAPLSNIVVFPMLFLSGTFFPRFLMPDWLQTVTNYLPLTPVIDGLRLLTTEGKSLLDLGPQLGLMAAWFVIIYAIAFRVFAWE